MVPASSNSAILGDCFLISSTVCLAFVLITLFVKATFLDETSPFFSVASTDGLISASKSLSEDEFPGGTTVVYGLKEGGVSIAPTSYKLVPAEILEEVEGLKAKIIAGEIVVPSTPDSYTEWMK